MPSWLITGITVVMVVAFLVGTWTLVQSWLNYRAVDGDNELTVYARSKLIRIGVLWFAQTALASIGLIAILVERTAVTRIVTSSLLVLLALGVAGVSFREYLDMRAGFKERDPSLH